MVDPNGSSKAGDVPQTSPDGSNGVPLTGGTSGSPDPIGLADGEFKQLSDVLKPVVLAKQLTPLERKHTPRVKKAAETMIEVWLALAVKKPWLAPGRDPQALYQQFKVLVGLKVLAPALRGLSRTAEDTVLTQLAELWKAVGDIYGVAQHVQGDPQVTDAVDRMAQALATGPKKQTAVKHAIKPIPHGKKGLKAIALAAEANGAPGSGAAGTSETTPPAEPAPAGTHPQGTTLSGSSGTGEPGPGGKS